MDIWLVFGWNCVGGSLLHAGRAHAGALLSQLYQTNSSAHSERLKYTLDYISDVPASEFPSLGFSDKSLNPRWIFQNSHSQQQQTMTFPFSFLSEATSLVWLECSLYSSRSCNNIKLLITVVSRSSSSHCSSRCLHPSLLSIKHSHKVHCVCS